MTVNPWLGRESVEPYLAAARRDGTGFFCVVKTSNAGGDIQDVKLSDGRPMWHHVATQVAEWGADASASTASPRSARSSAPRTRARSARRAS